MPKNLKLVGPATYSLVGVLSRPMKRGEIIKNVPDDVADRLLDKGYGEDDDFKPYFKEVHERANRRAVPASTSDENPDPVETETDHGKKPRGTRTAAAGKAPRQRRSADNE